MVAGCWAVLKYIKFWNLYYSVRGAIFSFSFVSCTTANPPVSDTTTVVNEKKMIMAISE